MRLLCAALLAVVCLFPSSQASAGLGEFADKVVGKVEGAATKVGDAVGGVATKAQGGVDRASGKVVDKIEPIQDKLARNKYVLTRRTDMRAGPKPRSRVTAVFKAGAKAVAGDRSDDGRWVQVRIRHDGKVFEGWVPAGNLRKDE